MLGRLLRWNARRREWNRAHERAWAGMTEPNESGLSSFQRMCEAAVVKALGEHGVRIAEREILEMEGPHVRGKENYIKARLAGTSWTLWVYVNAAGILSDTRTLVRLEDWDVRTPEEFISVFVERMLAGIRQGGDASV